MSKYIPTGGPAFPIECNIANGFRQDEGISIRDYFAAKAMAGALAGEPGSHLQPERLAKDSYAIADAMLAEKFKADEINEQARKEDGDDLPW